MTLRASIVRAFSTLALVSVAITAQAALNGIGESQTTFIAKATGGVTIEGKGTGVQVSEAGGTVTVTAPVNDLKTGMSLRDDHLKKYIHADKHPKASLAVARSALQFPEDGKTVTASAAGKFTLNGTTKDVKFDYQVTRTGSDYHVKGKTEIDILQFNIEEPCFTGICVKKDVKVQVQFKVRQ